MHLCKQETAPTSISLLCCHLLTHHPHSDWLLFYLASRVGDAPALPVKTNKQAVWQSLYERNERMKLQRENADMGANAQRNQEEAKRLRQRLGEERKKVQDAEGNARCVVVRERMGLVVLVCIVAGRNVCYFGDGKRS